jgi:hypothetical protein
MRSTGHPQQKPGFLNAIFGRNFTNRRLTFWNHGDEPQGKPWTHFPLQAAEYYTLRFAGLLD